MDNSSMQQGYCGFQFEDAVAGIHYGWLELGVDYNVSSQNDN